MMLGFPRPSTFKQAREKKQEAQKQEEGDDIGPEDMPPPSSRGSRSKRNSGMFDIGHTQLGMKSPEPAGAGAVQRRTSKRASSQDRHGQVYGDEVPAFRPETPDVTIDLASSQVSPRGDDAGLTVSPRRDDPTRYELPLRSRTGDQGDKTARDSLPRPRTRTLEERIRSKSPQTSRTDARKRIGSFQSVSHLPLQEDAIPGSSIGYPMIISGSGQNSASTSRQRLVQTPPRPLSPAAPIANLQPNPGDPVSDSERILRLMKTTGGRMHGILYFRLSKSSGVWQSGYCAINVSTGGLIYQTKGELAQTKTLIPDLRGCKVRTQFDTESQAPFLEMSTRASGLGIHLRPLIPETFDSWLAALLCWQPLKPSGAQHASSLHRHRTWRGLGSTSGSGSSTPTSSSAIERAPSRTNIRPRPLTEIYGPLRNSPTVKQSKILWWDLSAPQSAPVAPPRRISTYKQMRMSAGTPWRKSVVTIRENGLLEVVMETSKERDDPEQAPLKAAVDTTTLTRYAVQRLHPSVLDDEFCLAVYTQYKYRTGADELEDEDATGWPIFLSFESRSLFELWYATLRAFTVPEIYGPGAKALFAPGVKPQNQQVELNKDMFRIKRSLQLRITEAQVHVPRKIEAGVDPRSTAHDEWVVGDYHAEVQLDGETRGRTSLQTETSNPFWREDYEFIHLSPLTDQAFILLKSRQAGQRDWTLISDERYNPDDFRDPEHLDMVEDIHISPLDSLYGTVQLNLTEIERGTDIEKWWTVRNEYDETVGRIFLKVRLDEAVILMGQEYEELGTMLHTFSSGLATDVMSRAHDSSGRLAEILLNIFQVSGTANRWITTMVEDEIDSLQRDVSASRYRFSRRIASNDSYDSGVERELVLRDMGKSASVEANLLFRGNTPLTKALEIHMRRLGKEYLEEVLGERMRDIDESEPECEVDPNKIRSPEALQRNWRNLILLTESIWRSIHQSAHKCPPELRQLFRHIRACTEDRYGDFLRTVTYSSVSAFLFLRLLVPAILNPSLFGLLKELPRPKSRRTLTMIAKSLQTLANMTAFGAKEPWMEPMNAFLNSHRQEFKDFIDDVCAISQERPLNPSVSKDHGTALNVLENLSPASKEGAPSLPYLIDQSREYATLVSFWITTRGKAGSIPIVNEDLARFDFTCNRLRETTRNVLLKAAQEAPVDASGNDWNRLIAQIDTREASVRTTRSGMASPISPTYHEHKLSVSSQTTRPVPSRTSTTQSAPSAGTETQYLHSDAAKSDFGFPPKSVSGVSSPSAESFRASKALQEEEDSDDGEDDDDSRVPSRTRVDSSAAFNRDRAGTLPNSASLGGFPLHPLAWSEPGSAGSEPSKASSLRSIDTDAANGTTIGSDDRTAASGALPWSANLGVDEPGPSPMTSPKDPETRRLVDVLTFRRRDKKDKADKDREKEVKDESKKTKKKELREKKKQDKEKERGRDRGREGSSQDVGASSMASEPQGTSYNIFP